MDVPILIISYNNPTYVKCMVDQIRRYTTNFYVIDNLSTFSPHLEYLASIEKHVIRMDKNYGHSVYYEPRVWNLSGDKFIITDPDLLLNPNMPSNFIEILSQLSDEYNVNKVGLALDISGDIRKDFRLKSGETIVEWESQFWTRRIPHATYELYDAALDTTLCLFNKRIPGYSAIRVAGDFTCMHRPWYTHWETTLLPGELDAYRVGNVSSNYSLPGAIQWFQAGHNDSIIPFTKTALPISMDPEYAEPAGRQHYRLLEQLSAKVSNSTLVDIGTHKGMSAYALSTNPTNRVISFDIVAKPGLPVKSNIEYHTDDLMSDEGRSKWSGVLLSSPFIFLDIDPHEGAREYEFYEWLRDNDYKGFLICDDIWYFKEMRDNFWYKIPSEHKIDVTDKGHSSGTGIVRFHPSDLWPAKDLSSNWTVVTAYFDLTKMIDASPSIKNRPASHYLASATSTLMLEQNVVVFCEPDMVDTLKALRPLHLLSRTRFISTSFEDFPMTKYRNQIEENRKKIPDMDDRNTVSYYLLCMARYAMLKQTIADNPFGSTHFAWLNICIERMGWKNLIQLPRVFEVNRDKFSTCYIDYQRKEDYLERVMRYGRCSMCSGFFTGNARYMETFCDRIEDAFVECLGRGYGHADEQLFSLVYFDDPSIFEVYYGDYAEMITNYEWIRDSPQKPLYYLIKHSYDAGEYTTCLPGCIALWRSWKRGYATLSEQEVTHLVWYYERALVNAGLPRELE